MSLDIYLKAVRETEVYSANITHNLTEMADEAGIYGLLWRPNENTVALDLIAPLESAIDDMGKRPDHYKAFDWPNGWGTYDDFVPWLKELLAACRSNPDAKIRVWV